MDENFDFETYFYEAQKKLGRANIIITGKTGVGKSTLINSVFGQDLAKVGVGTPVTKNIQEYTKDGIPISLFDTRGLELGNYQEIAKELKDEIGKRRGADPDKHINICWYCINDTSKRLEDCEFEFVRELSSSVKVIVVLTQSLNKEDKTFYNFIKEKFYSIAQVIPVLALPYPTPLGDIPSFGLNDLIAITKDVLPEAQKSAFIAAQKIDLAAKVTKARSFVAGAAAAAAAAGAVPIPFSDAAVLAPIQVGMIASISLTMGLELNKAFLTTIVTSAAGVIGASYAGRAIVSGLLKLIPGAGTLVGGAISAATAATLTTTMGITYIEALSYLIKNGKEMTAEMISATWMGTLRSSKGLL